MPPVSRRRWSTVLGSAVVAGAAVAALATLKDWRRNPGGLFHDGQGTDWAIVFETAVSWFLPVAATVAVLGALVLLVAAWRR